MLRAARTLWKTRNPRHAVTLLPGYAALFGRTWSGEAGRFDFAQGRRRADRTQILIHLALVHGARRYVEIGVRDRSRNFDHVPCAEKLSVDPDPAARADVVATSDAFFAGIGDRRFDLIFIDGLHTGEQVARDIAGALAALAPGGTIVLHDMNPPSALEARETYAVNGRFPAWCGTSWRGFAERRATDPDLDMAVVDTDWGVGVIRRGRQALYQGPWRDYADLAANRRALLNLIPVAEFLRRCPAPGLRPATPAA